MTPRSLSRGRCMTSLQSSSLKFFKNSQNNEFDTKINNKSVKKLNAFDSEQKTKHKNSILGHSFKGTRKNTLSNVNTETISRVKSHLYAQNKSNKFMDRRFLSLNNARNDRIKFEGKNMLKIKNRGKFKIKRLEKNAAEEEKENGKYIHGDDDTKYIVNQWKDDNAPAKMTCMRGKIPTYAIENFKNQHCDEDIHVLKHSGKNIMNLDDDIIGSYKKDEIRNIFNRKRKSYGDPDDDSCDDDVKLGNSDLFFENKEKFYSLAKTMTKKTYDVSQMESVMKNSSQYDSECCIQTENENEIECSSVIKKTRKEIYLEIIKKNKIRKIENMQQQQQQQDLLEQLDKTFCSMRSMLTFKSTRTERKSELNDLLSKYGSKISNVSPIPTALTSPPLASNIFSLSPLLLKSPSILDDKSNFLEEKAHEEKAKNEDENLKKGKGRNKRSETNREDSETEKPEHMSKEKRPTYHTKDDAITDKKKAYEDSNFATKASSYGGEINIKENSLYGKMHACENITYDALWATLAFDKRKPASNKLQTFEEIQEIEKKLLEKKEAERLERIKEICGRESDSETDDNEDYRKLYHVDIDDDNDSEYSERCDADVEVSENKNHRCANESKYKENENDRKNLFIENSICGMIDECHGDTEFEVDECKNCQTKENKVYRYDTEGGNTSHNEKKALSESNERDQNCNKIQEKERCENDFKTDDIGTICSNEGTRDKIIKESFRDSGNDTNETSMPNTMHAYVHNNGVVESTTEMTEFCLDDREENEMDKKMKEWMNNGDDEIGMSFKPKCPYTREQAHELFRSRSAKSIWKLIYRILAFQDTENSHRKDRNLRRFLFSILCYLIDRSVLNAETGEGESLHSMWLTLEDPLISIVEKYKNDVIQFFLKLLLNICDRSFPYHENRLPLSSHIKTMIDITGSKSEKKKSGDNIILNKRRKLFHENHTKNYSNQNYPNSTSCDGCEGQNDYNVVTNNNGGMSVNYIQDSNSHGSDNTDPEIGDGLPYPLPQRPKNIVQFLRAKKKKNLESKRNQTSKHERNYEKMEEATNHDASSDKARNLCQCFICNRFKTVLPSSSLSEIISTVSESSPTRSYSNQVSTQLLDPHVSSAQSFVHSKQEVRTKISSTSVPEVSSSRIFSFSIPESLSVPTSIKYISLFPATSLPSLYRESTLSPSLHDILVLEMMTYIFTVTDFRGLCTPVAYLLDLFATRLSKYVHFKSCGTLSIFPSRHNEAEKVSEGIDKKHEDGNLDDSRAANDNEISQSVDNTKKNNQSIGSNHYDLNSKDYSTDVQNTFFNNDDMISNYTLKLEGRTKDVSFHLYPPADNFQLSTLVRFFQRKKYFSLEHRLLFNTHFFAVTNENYNNINSASTDNSKNSFVNDTVDHDDRYPNDNYNSDKNNSCDDKKDDDDTHSHKSNASSDCYSDREIDEECNEKHHTKSVSQRESASDCYWHDIEMGVRSVYFRDDSIDEDLKKIFICEDDNIQIIDDEFTMKIALKLFFIVRQVIAQTSKYIPSFFCLGITILYTFIYQWTYLLHLYRCSLSSFYATQRSSCLNVFAASSAHSSSTQTLSQSSETARLCSLTKTRRDLFVKLVLYSIENDSHVFSAILLSLCVSLKQLQENSKSAYIPCLHLLLPHLPKIYFSFLHFSVVCDLENINSALLKSVISSIRALWTECGKIVDSILIPLSLYDKLNEKGVCMLTPRYYESYDLRKRKGKAIQGPNLDMEDYRKTKKQEKDFKKFAMKQIKMEAYSTRIVDAKAETFRKKKMSDRYNQVVGIMEQDQAEFKKMSTSGGFIRKYRRHKVVKGKRMEGKIIGKHHIDVKRKMKGKLS